MSVPLKRKHFYVMERLYTTLVVWMLPLIARARITPNQVTITNLANGVLILVLISTHYYAAAAVLIQIYLFLDILDGNLARYRNMSTRLGGILDNVGDRFFYNAVMVVIGLSTAVHWGWILFFLLAHNLHSAIATLYIVPSIRKVQVYRRFGLKKILMERGIILGMDLSSQDLLMSVLIVTPWRGMIVPVAGGLYLLDLIYRLVELARNNRCV